MMITTTLVQPAYLQQRFEYSRKMLDALRHAVQRAVSPLARNASLTIVVVGSYGRYEVSSVSDIDFFIVHDGMSENRLDEILHEVSTLIRPFSAPGESDITKFGQGALSLYADLSHHIGWKCESSTALTRRMLLLFEGQPLFGEVCFRTWQRDLLRRYVPEDQGKGLSTFMLNDLVRYYRTLMANFEEKKAEGKAWGVRNIKLRFSRKLLFLGGVIVIAETFGLSAHEKVLRLEQLLALTPLQRLATLGHANRHTGALLEQYAFFLRAISTLQNRQHLNGLTPDCAQTDPIYQELKVLGVAFSEQLERWLRTQYRGHPILHALLF